MRKFLALLLSGDKWCAQEFLLFIAFHCKTIWQKQQESNYSQQQLPLELKLITFQPNICGKGKWALTANFSICEENCSRISSHKNDKSLIYSSSCCSKPVWLFFVRETRKYEFCTGSSFPCNNYSCLLYYYYDIIITIIGPGAFNFKMVSKAP